MRYGRCAIRAKIARHARASPRPSPCRRYRRVRCRYAASRSSGQLSIPSPALDRAVSGRRQHRSHRAIAGRVARGAARPAGHHREQAGRRHQYRRAGGRQCAGRRLHAAVRRGDERDQSVALQILAVRFSARHCAGGRARRIAAGARRHPGTAGQHRAGVHRLRQGQSGQDQLRLVRRAHHQSSGHRAVQDLGRDRRGARALSRRRADADRSVERPHPGRHRRAAEFAAAHQVRRRAGARSAVGEADAGAAGRADHGRDDCRFRGHAMDGARRSKRHAE